MKRIAVVLVVCLSLTLTSGLAQSSKSKSKTQLQKNLKSVLGKKKQIQHQIQVKKREAKIVMSDIQQVDGRLGDLEGKIETTAEKLSSNVKVQASLKTELSRATIQLAKRKEEVRKRLREMYMAEESSVPVALLKSKDLGDLAGRKTTLELIAEKDRSLFNEVIRLQRSIQDKKKRQDALVAETRELKARQEGQQSGLKVARQEKKNLLSELQSQQAELRKQYDELDQESDSIAAQIRALQAKRRGTYQEVRPYTGVFQHPVAGRITSGFGMRFHPILKERRKHTGLDFGAAYGTSIYAAGPGVVLSAGYRKGYGNTVVIDHGGGISTLYGHASRLFVREGQSVKRGDKIAAVGSTGLSTGPHLHFEVRVNGTPVDPRKYL